jgi:hypothetical protein
VTAELLLDGEARALTRKAVEMALAGNGMALRLCLDRILPPRRERHVSLKLPTLESAADAVAAIAEITAALAAGEVTLGEASQLTRLIEGYVRALEAGEFEQRLRALERNCNAEEP